MSENIQDRNLLDTHLMEQLVDKDEADLIKEYITSIPRKKKETVFGIFIGYSIEYKGTAATNDEYDRRVIEENIKQILAVKNHIIDAINNYHVSNYEFNFYFLPFHNAARDRKVIMKSLTSGKGKLEWGEIKNG